MRQRITRRSPDVPRGHDQAGFTLVELLVAILLLGIILSALASTLIQFGNVTVTNERRVEATAYLTRVHENLQSLRWDDAGIYESELPDLLELGADLGADPPTLDGEPIVVLPDPDSSGCDAGDPDCARSELVPRPSTTFELDDREYRLLQAVTWDTSAASDLTVKRFTTIVTWDVRGEPFTQRFESTRAGTIDERGERTPPQVLSLIVSPDRFSIDEDGFNDREVRVRVTFNRAMDTATTRLVVLDAEDALQEASVAMSRVAGTLDAFEYTIAPGQFRFPLGESDLMVRGRDGPTSVESVETIEVLPPGAAMPPVLSSVTATPATTVFVAHNGPQSGRLCSTLTVRARVDGLQPDGIVTANYITTSGTGATMDPPATITGSNDEFVLQFAAGSISPWEPTPARKQGNTTTPAVDVRDTFVVVARNPGEPASTPRDSQQITFRAAQTNNGHCP